MVDLGCGAHAKFSTGFDQTFPARASETLDKQKFDSTIIGKFSRWNYARVVQNEQISRTEQRFKFDEPSIFDGLCIATQDHHAGVFASRQWPLRDQSGRQIVVVIA